MFLFLSIGQYEARGPRGCAWIGALSGVFLWLKRQDRSMVGLHLETKPSPPAHQPASSVAPPESTEVLSTVLYYTILHYTTLYYTILHYTTLYHTILHYTILYCTVREYPRRTTTDLDMPCS